MTSETKHNEATASQRPEEKVQAAATNTDAAKPEQSAEKPAEEKAQESAAQEQFTTKTEEGTAPTGEEDKTAKELEAAQAQIAQLKDQLLRQMAEFDNFRKRTLKEKSELILNGGQKVLESMLPVLDDLERAEDNIEKSNEVETLKEGVRLILNKLTKTLSAHGLKKMETEGAAFDTDFHEAIALVPAQDESQKNHIIDCVQPGYMLNEKVLRHAKVVVGQ